MRHHSAPMRSGPLRAGNLVGHAAPAKTPRRTVGNERGNLGRLRVGQEQERAGHDFSVFCSVVRHCNTFAC